MSTKKKPSNKTPQLLDAVGTETLLTIISSDTKTEAAQKLGIDRKTLYLRMEKYGLAQHIEQIPRQALEALQMGSVKAAENYVSKIDHRDPRVSMEASGQVLDRIGLGVKQQTNIQNNFTVEVVDWGQTND